MRNLLNRKWLCWDRKIYISSKVTKMGSIIGHKIDYNGVGALRGQRHIPSQNWPGLEINSSVMGPIQGRSSNIPTPSYYNNRVKCQLAIYGGCTPSASLYLYLVQYYYFLLYLQQVFNKLLSLANSAAQPKADYSLWTNLLLSTSGVRLTVLFGS